MNEFSPETVRAAAAVPEVSESKEPRLLTLSNGIQLKMRSIPPLLYNTAANSIKAPEVPKVYIKDDERFEDNPNDPDYLQAVTAYTLAQRLVMLNLMFLRGTEIVSIPDGLPRPEDDEWIENLEADAKIIGFALEIPRANSRERYLSWMRLFALANAEDLAKAEVAVMRASLTEEEVAEAAETFRSVQERPADNGTADPDNGENGNHLRAIPAGIDY